jgi:ribose 5-phosphate isomerase A
MGRLEAKRRAAVAAADFIQDGMTVGLGTGSSAALVVEELGRRVREGLRIRGVPTSQRTAVLARELGIPLLGLDAAPALDLTVDGADEITPDGSAVKGGGGALCREKVVAAATAGPRIAVVDGSKLVERLGAFPLPVEVVPFATAAVARWIEGLGASATRRDAAGGPNTTDAAPYLTDNGNHILDCRFGPRSDWPEISRRLDALPGLVCHGLFLQCFDVIVVGSDEGAEVRRVARPAGHRFPPA